MADAAKNVGGAGSVNPFALAAFDDEDVDADDDGEGEEDAAARTATVNDDAAELLLGVFVRSTTTWCERVGADAKRGFGGRPRGAGTLAWSLTGRTFTGSWRELTAAVKDDDDDDGDEGDGFFMSLT